MPKHYKTISVGEEIWEELNNSFLPHEDWDARIKRCRDAEQRLPDLKKEVERLNEELENKPRRVAAPIRTH